MAVANARVEGVLATTAGGQPAARAEAAVVGPIATSNGRSGGGQDSASNLTTEGLATTSMVLPATAARACDVLSSIAQASFSAAPLVESARALGSRVEPRAPSNADAVDAPTTHTGGLIPSIQ